MGFGVCEQLRTLLHPERYFHTAEREVQAGGVLPSPLGGGGSAALERFCTVRTGRIFHTCVLVSMLQMAGAAAILAMLCFYCCPCPLSCLLHSLR